MNGKARLAWELYLKMETSGESFSLLQLIANDAYKMGQFYYAAKAFDMLERLDPNPEYWEGKRGACVGVFQAVLPTGRYFGRKTQKWTHTKEKSAAEFWANLPKIVQKGPNFFEVWFSFKNPLDFWINLTGSIYFSCFFYIIKLLKRQKYQLFKKMSCAAELFG
jgi:hypothetical protein